MEFADFIDLEKWCPAQSQTLHWESAAILTEIYGGPFSTSYEKNKMVIGTV